MNLYNINDNELLVWGLNEVDAIDTANQLNGFIGIKTIVEVDKSSKLFIDTEDKANDTSTWTTLFADANMEAYVRELDVENFSNALKRRI